MITYYDEVARYTLSMPPFVREDAGVYSLSCPRSGKTYIGCSKDMLLRLRTHVRQLRLGIHKNVKLQNSWNKYGEREFTFAILSYTHDNGRDQFEVEKKYISLFDSYYAGFNMTVGGEGAGADSPTLIAKRTAALKKRYAEDPTYRLKRSEAAKVQFARLTKEERSALGKLRSLKAAERFARMSEAEKEARSKMLSEASRKRWDKYYADRAK